MKSIEIFLIFLRLGFTSFGGPIAHLSYFHDEFVKKRKWLNEHAYADLVALCQFLPGPASSQVGMAIGLSHSGIWGSFLAWLGFTLPSAIFLVLFATGLSSFSHLVGADWIHGLKIVAVAVVAHAVWGMGKKLCPDKERVTIAIASSVIVLTFTHPFTQVIVLLISGVFGAFYFRLNKELPHAPVKTHLSKKWGSVFLSLFFIILFSLPLLRTVHSSTIIQLIDSFYRAGALVFGGGHVVLPLLEAEVVANGQVSKDMFMAGYGLAQAVPGPLFTFSAYLGALISNSPHVIAGAAICLVSIFLPSFLLICGVLPFWEQVRAFPHLRKAMVGINASVVGILLAALYQPVWMSAIFSARDFALATIGFVMLEFWRLPSWLVVVTSVIVSLFIY